MLFSSIHPLVSNNAKRIPAYFKYMAAYCWNSKQAYPEVQRFSMCSQNASLTCKSAKKRITVNKLNETVLVWNAVRNDRLSSVMAALHCGTTPSQLQCGPEIGTYASASTYICYISATWITNRCYIKVAPAFPLLLSLWSALYWSRKNKVIKKYIEQTDMPGEAHTRCIWQLPWHSMIIFLLYFRPATSFPIVMQMECKSKTFIVQESQLGRNGGGCRWHNLNWSVICWW